MRIVFKKKNLLKIQFTSNGNIKFKQNYTMKKIVLMLITTSIAFTQCTYKYNSEIVFQLDPLN